MYIEWRSSRPIYPGATGCSGYLPSCNYPLIKISSKNDLSHFCNMIILLLLYLIVHFLSYPFE